MFRARTISFLSLLISLFLMPTSFAQNWWHQLPNAEQMNSLNKIQVSSKRRFNSEKPLNLLVWNIFKNQLPQFKREFERLSKESDLLITQEIFLNHAWKKYFDVTFPDFERAMAVSFLYRFENLASTGVATFSRVPAIMTNAIRSPDFEPVTSTPKMSMMSFYSIKDSEQTLLVINTHGINFNTGFGAFDRQINDLYSLVKDHEGPMIWAGDFNTWNPMRMDFLISIVTKLNLVSVTFRDDQRTAYLGNKLDHIFYRGFKQVENSDETYVLPQSSDHAAMTVQLNWDLSPESKNQEK